MEFEFIGFSKCVVLRVFLVDETIQLAESKSNDYDRRIADKWSELLKVYTKKNIAKLSVKKEFHLSFAQLRHSVLKTLNVPTSIT